MVNLSFCLGMSYHQELLGTSQAGIVSALMIAGALFVIDVKQGGRLARFLETTNIQFGRVLKIEEVCSPEHSKYRMEIQLENAGIDPKTIHLTRLQKDFGVGQRVELLISPEENRALLEQDLGAGLSFSNIWETRQTSMMPLIRVLTIPLLSFLPLVETAAGLPNLLRDLAMQTDPSIAYSWSLFAQILWLACNRRSFRFGPVPFDT